MRRQAQPLPISLKQLQHFAGATVAITALLALFAGGDGFGVAGEIEARKATNDLIDAQQQSMGTKKIANNLVVRKGTTGSFGNDEGGSSDFGGGGGGGGYAGPPPEARQSKRPDPSRRFEPENLPSSPGDSVTVNGVPGPKGDPLSAKKKGNAADPQEPTDEQRAQAQAAARQRSGAPADSE